jgi:hypothetical protein
LTRIGNSPYFVGEKQRKGKGMKRNFIFAAFSIIVVLELCSFKIISKAGTI